MYSILFLTMYSSIFIYKFVMEGEYHPQVLVALENLGSLLSDMGMQEVYINMCICIYKYVHIYI
jgi:hypothetical protein